MGEFFINEEYFWVNEENFGMMCGGMASGGENGISGRALLFCDQKSNQKSLGGKIRLVPPINARGTRATKFGTIAARLFLHGAARRCAA